MHAYLCAHGASRPPRDFGAAAPLARRFGAPFAHNALNMPIPVLLTALLCLPQGEVTYPPRPGPREFVRDEAGLLGAEASAQVRVLCDEALTARRVPIVVVTIRSLGVYGAGNWPIERYAMNLMAEWGVGFTDWNYGMLLLVSTGDRKARIELGNGWTRRHDDQAARVMSDRVIPQFKQGRFEAGIVAGVTGLHALAMALRADGSAQPAPAAPAPTGAPPINTAPQPTPTPIVRPPDPSPGLGGGACVGLSLPVILGVVVIGILLSRLGGGMSSWGGGGFSRRRGFGGF